ncbi:DUF192 domain-containing protein [Carboxylicivirga taeanensis]|uniref:DUF192 domain-containing protein n=1 Tax=Carboxylicivirga taeanensis TaxID=1416875 RepID=UPI003F6E41A4
MKKIEKQTKGTKTLFPLLLLLGLAVIAITLNTKTCTQPQKGQQFKGQYAFTKEGTLTFHRKKLAEQLAIIDIEIAENEQERALGLMHRYTMSDRQGMLFIMDREEPQSFWMKNTYISLDILYINEQYEIVKIHKHTQPFSPKGIPSVKPAKFVVEVVAGFCNKHGINEGDSISFTR